MKERGQLTFEAWSTIFVALSHRTAWDALSEGHKAGWAHVEEAAQKDACDRVAAFLRAAGADQTGDGKEALEGICQIIESGQIIAATT